MRRLLGLSAILTSFLTGGCPNPPVEPENPAESGLACKAFCARVGELCGYGVTSTPEGVECQVVCRDLLVGPYGADLRCIQEARTCERLESCTFDSGIEERN